MSRGFFVTGTDTGVGKTLVSAALVHGFAACGMKAVGMKPVASGAETDASGRLVWGDVEALRGASNVEAPLEWINPYRFQPAVAPHLAAEKSGQVIDLAAIAAAYGELFQFAEVIVVEGVGGFLVPLNSRETVADLARLLNLPVLLVVGMRLGCINHALLTVEALSARGLRLAGWVANTIDPGMDCFDENFAALKKHLPAPCLGVLPWMESPDLDQAAAALNLSLLTG